MKEITEDYVSFEIAKLLKEKGFEQYKCPHSYSSKGVFKWSDNLNPYEYAAPSQAMVMKWLREVHKIYIDINIKIILEQWAGYNISIYKTDTNDGLLDTIIFRKDLKDNISYEKACEAAIKYCLEHLI